MKIYTGISDGMGGAISVAENGGKPKPLPPRLDLFNHSPTGFSWGYGGSGPAQTALAILADHLGTVIDASHARSRKAVGNAAVRLHQRFKWDVVARWDQKGNFSITSAEIDHWLRQLKPQSQEDC